MSPKMKRLQFYVEPELGKKLKRIAAIRRVSRAHLLHEATRKLVQEEPAEEPDSLLDIVDLVKSTRGRLSRISEQHDKYLAQWELARTRKK